MILIGCHASQLFVEAELSGESQLALRKNRLPFCLRKLPSGMGERLSGVSNLAK